jgi:hypothetical protein
MKEHRPQTYEEWIELCRKYDYDTYPISHLGKIAASQCVDRRLRISQGLWNYTNKTGYIYVPET